VHKPFKACARPGCPEVTTDRQSGYCPRCKQKMARKYDNDRASSNQRGYDYMWQAARAHYLKSYAKGLCEDCYEKGELKAAQQVHHIVPIAEDKTKRLEYNNMRALCRECHDAAHRGTKDSME